MDINRKYIDDLTVIGFDSKITNDKFFEATLISNNPDDWNEWFVYY